MSSDFRGIGIQRTGPDARTAGLPGISARSRKGDEMTPGTQHDTQPGERPSASPGRFDLLLIVMVSAYPLPAVTLVAFLAAGSGLPACRNFAHTAGLADSIARNGAQGGGRCGCAFRGRLIGPVVEQDHQAALESVLLFPRRDKADEDGEELAGLYAASRDGAQHGDELCGITGVSPGRGKALLTEHLPDDRPGITQGRAITQGRYVDRGRGVQILGEEVTRHPDRLVHVGTEAGQHESGGQQGELGVQGVQGGVVHLYMVLACGQPAKRPAAAPGGCRCLVTSGDAPWPLGVVVRVLQVSVCRR